MQTNYEIAYGKIIPEFRRAVAREMHAHYHMKQSDIAKRLGITQAAVSKYLNSGVVKESKQYKEVATFIKASLEGNEKLGRQALCKACQTSRKFDCAFMFKQ
jgi:predicted transcriptional regulator